MFRRKKTRASEKNGSSPNHTRPGSDGSDSHDVHTAPRLPEKEYRTSLILPALAKRFDLLRDKDGSLVPYERMKTALRAQRETGYLNEDEEEALLFHYKLQAMKEGQTFPLRSNSTTSLVASPSWPSMPSRSSQSSGLDELAGDDQPATLADFHKLRKRAQSSASLFASSSGNEGLREHKQKNAPSTPRRAYSSRSTPTGSPSRAMSPLNSTQSDHHNDQTDLQSPSIITNTATDLQRAKSQDSVKLSSPGSSFEFPRNMPIARARAKNTLNAVIMTPDQISRISRVLDDIELDFTGTISHTLMSSGSSNTGSYDAETTGLVSPKQSNGDGRAFEDDTEAIDPAMLRIARKSSTKAVWAGPRLSTVESISLGGEDDAASLNVNSLESSLLLTPRTSASPNVPHSPFTPSPAPSLAPPVDIHSDKTPQISPFTVFQTMFPSPETGQTWNGPKKQSSDDDDVRYWARQSGDAQSIGNVESGNVDNADATAHTGSKDEKGRTAPVHNHKASLSSQISSSIQTSTENDCLFSPKMNASSSSLVSDGSSYCADDRDTLSDESGELPSFSSAESAARSAKRHPFEFDAHLDDRAVEILDQDTDLSKMDEILGGLQIHDLAFVQSELVRSASQRAHTRLVASQASVISRDSGYSVEADSSVESGQRSNAVEATEEQGTPALTSAHDSPLSEAHASLPPTPADQLNSAYTSPTLSNKDYEQHTYTPRRHIAPRPKSPPVHRPMSPFSPVHNQTSPSPGRNLSPPVPANHTSSPLLPPDNTNSQTPQSPPREGLPRIDSTKRSAQTQSVLIRDVAAQAERATATLKGNDPLSTPKSLKKRKSSKHLVISPPQFMSSSINMALLRDREASALNGSANPSQRSTEKPKLRARSPQRPFYSEDLRPSDIPRDLAREQYLDYIGQDASPVLGHNFQFQQSTPMHNRLDSRQSNNEDSPSGLHRLLTKLRRRKEKDSGKDKETSPVSLPPGARSIRPFSPHLLSAPSPDPANFQSRQTFGDFPPSQSEVTTPVATTPLSAVSRAPVQYDVGSHRKRAHSVSSDKSNSTPPKTGHAASPLDSIHESHGDWTVPDAETSMASWRSSNVADEVEATSAALKKLRDAASALGLDPVKVDALVGDVSAASSRPESQRSLVRRTVIIPSRPPSVVPEAVVEATVHVEESIPEVESVHLRSVHDRTPTPPPVHQRHTRRASHDIMVQHPLPDSPVQVDLQRTPSIVEPVLEASYTDDATHDIVLARGELGEDSHDIEVTPTIQQSSTLNDRLEIDEMSDGSLVWQVVRNLRHTSQLSDIDFDQYNHSRQSSVESAIIPPKLAPAPLRLPIRAAAKDMRLVISKSHKRVRSNENGVGNIGYIKSPVLKSVPPIDEEGEGRSRAPSSAASDQSIDIYQADENVVNDLIQNLTSNLDAGSFNLVRATSIQRLTRAREERERQRNGPVHGLRLPPRFHASS